MKNNGISAFGYFLIHTGWVVGAGATGLSLLALSLHGHNSEFWWYGLLTGTATAALYTAHRIIGTFRKTTIELPDRFHLVASRKWDITFFFLLWLILSAVNFFLHFDIKLIAWLIPAAILGIGYSLPIIPPFKKRLREYGLLKIIWIGLVWGWVTAFIPSWYLSGIPLDLAIIQAIERALFIIAITIPFDIRDRYLDKQDGILTIPNLLSKSMTITLGIVLFVLAMFAGVWNGFHFLNISYPITYLVMLPLFIWIIIKSYKTEHDFYIGGLTDGTMFLMYVLYLILTLLIP